MALRLFALRLLRLLKKLQDELGLAYLFITVAAVQVAQIQVPG